MKNSEIKNLIYKDYKLSCSFQTEKDLLVYSEPPIEHNDDVLLQICNFVVKEFFPKEKE